MKPVVGAMQAWQCTVISVFAIVILGVLGILFKQNHPELVGSEEDPKDGSAVAGTIFVSVMIYVVRHTLYSAHISEKETFEV
ncbi:hypothetical protein SGCOL_006959 [Colletotrichum sp. CLE4]